jgi:putative oxidoreductase
MNRILIGDLISSVFILIFSYTAISKVLTYDTFVFHMQMSPWRLMHLTAPELGWIIPGIEILLAAILALGLFYNYYQKVGLYASTVLIIIFEIYIAGMLLSGIKLPCTCGGVISSMSWPQHLVFNAILIAFGMTTLLIEKKANYNIHHSLKHKN